MPKIQLAPPETVADLAPLSSLVSEALLASLFGVGYWLLWRRFAP